MTQIMQWLETFWITIQSVIDFVIARIEDTVYIVGLFLEMTPVLPAFFTWLPPVVWLPLSTLLGVVIIFRFLGMGD